MKQNQKPRWIGYARVSTNEQDLRLQQDALMEAGCSKQSIFTDKVSGTKSARPGLDRCLSALQPGDTLVVWRLDRLGRSVRHLIDLVDELGKRNVGFKSLRDGAIDTTTASGKLIFHIFTALAEFERGLIQERTKAGLAAARARGRMGGRKPVSADHPKVQTALTLFRDKKMAIPDICKTLNLSRATLYRYVAVGQKTVST